MSDNMVLEQAWGLVENQFDLQELFGEVGSLFLEEQAAKKCLHTMAISMSVLAGLAPLANGAQVRIWSEPTPLVLATVLINPPQSRKSQTTGLLRELGTVIDQACHERERASMLQRHPAAEEDIHTETPPSNVLEGFTPEARKSVTQSWIDTSTPTNKDIYIQVVPGRAGGGSFRRKKTYIAKEEFAYRMCARRPTSAMPKPFLCCEPAFCCSMVVM